MKMDSTEHFYKKDRTEYLNKNDSTDYFIVSISWKWALL